jgi:uncharacterized membrane protein YcaP (DUF421 family)
VEVVNGTSPWVTPIWTVLHTLVIYACLVVSVATVGRQQVAQLTLIDYVIVALLGSAVETGLYLGGGSLSAGLTSAATLLLANRAFRVLARRYAPLRRYLVGTPLLLIHDGRIDRRNLARAHMTEENLMTAIRMRGYDRVEQIRFAVVEPNGAVGVVPKDGDTDRTTSLP